MRPEKADAKLIFGEALSMTAPAEREAYLDRACGGDTALRREVESLLSAYSQAGDFLDQIRQIPAADFVIERTGRMVGRYKLLEQIGEGGFGVVYMAEQVEPVQRKVALKIIKPGMDTKQVIARFEAERQALALMDHPSIAKILDAGATEAGRPYFVMELVRGIPITDYCDQKALSTGERLRLFIQVCEAVQHAHQKGIIHRDLKPSNVLVTLHDGHPVPKVIDFGVAKALGQKLTERTLVTGFAQMLGTPAYMSPEQAELSGLDIDTRSDIYSLGVLLYELLTGATPFDKETLAKAALDEIRRMIQETEPSKPSTCIQTLGDRLTEVAKRRHTEPATLSRLVRGDLDWIVMKALEKDRTRRYETANGLAADVARHLGGEPVVARPPSNLYRFQKLVGRHQVVFAASGAVIVALIVGLGISTWEYFKERDARQRAVAAEREQEQLFRQAEASQKKSLIEAAKATAISDFLNHMLGSANPDNLNGSDYTVRQLLDDFSAHLGNQLENQPEVEAAVRATIGRTYHRLGVAEEACAHLERALTLRRRIFGTQAKQVAETLKDYAWASFENGQRAQAELCAREALQIYRQHGISGEPVISVLFALQRTLIMENRSTEADAVTEQAFVIAGASPTVEFPELASMIHGLADVRNNQSRYAEAESLARTALEMHRRLHGPEHPETAWALFSLGVSLRNQQKLTDAETVLREAVDIASKYYAFDYKTVQFPMNELKSVLRAKGDTIALTALESQGHAQRMVKKNGDPEGEQGDPAEETIGEVLAKKQQAAAIVVQRAILPRDWRARAQLVDLSSNYNGALSINWHDDEEDNNLAELPAGVSQFEGVEFDVRGIVQAPLSATGVAPQRLSNIIVQQACKRLHFLHAAIFAGGLTNRTEIGRYMVHFEQGPDVVIPLRAGIELADWWQLPGDEPTRVPVAWQGLNGKARRNQGGFIRLFHLAWDNPQPGVVVRSIDLATSHGQARPFLVALTVE